MITIEALSKSYRRQKVLDQIGLNIHRGEIFALLGPNGSGKSTLLKSLLGIVRPSRESTIIIGEQKVGYMPQFLRLMPHLKISELVDLFEQLRGTKAEHKISLMEELNIGPFFKKPFGELSGGMMQKVNILLCFMFDPSLYLLDEPTQGLDPQISFYVKQLLLKKRTEGKTVVFTSHILSEVEMLADRMALLVEGKLYRVISPEKLKNETQKTSLEEALQQFWSTLK